MEQDLFLETLTVEELIRSIAIARHMCNSADISDPPILSCLHSLQRYLKLESWKGTKQRHISDLFKYLYTA